VVVSRWNGEVTERLLEGCLRALEGGRVPRRNVTILRVPGAFELVPASSRVIGTLKPDAVIALAALIRGETPHFDVLAFAVGNGLASLAAATAVPIVFGVLTCETVAQAMARAGGDAGNKGVEAAETAMAMATLFEKLDAGRSRVRG
jgi:6,7-dimethyl-8-ribityllumazine synthase